jgi:hypothetical protein
MSEGFDRIHQAMATAAAFVEINPTWPLNPARAALEEMLLAIAKDCEETGETGAATSARKLAEMLRKQIDAEPETDR